MQKYLRCISNADNKFKICETSRCKKFWRFDDIGKSCLNLIIIQRSPALRSYTGVLSSTPFSLLTAQKKSIFIPKWIACVKMLVNDTVPIEDAHIFGVFFYILITLTRKKHCIKKLSIQYVEMCNDEFIGIWPLLQKNKCLEHLSYFSHCKTRFFHWPLKHQQSFDRPFH